MCPLPRNNNQLNQLGWTKRHTRICIYKYQCVSLARNSDKRTCTQWWCYWWWWSSQGHRTRIYIQFIYICILFEIVVATRDTWCVCEVCLRCRAVRGWYILPRHTPCQRAWPHIYVCDNHLFVMEQYARGIWIHLLNTIKLSFCNHSQQVYIYCNQFATRRHSDEHRSK